MSMRVAGLILVLLFIFASASFVALRSAPAHAQESQAGKVYRIGLLRGAPWPKTFVEAFQQGLQERGYVDGRNVILEFKVTDGSIDELRRLAGELVRSKADVIVASGAPSALAAKHATTSVPIVFVSVFDPIEIGLVPSLARPAQASRRALERGKSRESVAVQRGRGRSAHPRLAASVGAGARPE
jgi:ABC-type uncharacterized transport system substrate-binding protein